MNWKIIEPNDRSELEVYVKFIETHPKGHFLQHPSWRNVKSHWLWYGITAVNDAGKMQGAISVLLRPLPMGFHIAYAPRGPVCDRNDEAVLVCLQEGLKFLGKKKHCIITYLDPDEPEEAASLKDILLGLGYHRFTSDSFSSLQPQNVFRLPLKGHTSQSLLTHFSQKTRYNIRLAQRKGVCIRSFSGDSFDPEELSAFSRLMETTGKRDGFLVRNEAYFSKLLTSLGSKAALYMAYLEDIPIGGAIAIFCAGKAWYLYGASANEYRNTMPNYLLQYTMLCDALGRNMDLYDFRGIPGSYARNDRLYGLYRFKKGFNGELIKFVGLFVYYNRPITGRVFYRGLQFYRKLRRNTKTRIRES